MTTLRYPWPRELSPNFVEVATNATATRQWSKYAP